MYGTHNSQSAVRVRCGGARRFRVTVSRETLHFRRAGAAPTRHCTAVKTSSRTSSPQTSLSVSYFKIKSLCALLRDRNRSPLTVHTSNGCIFSIYTIFLKAKLYNGEWRNAITRHNPVPEPDRTPDRTTRTITDTRSQRTNG